MRITDTSNSSVDIANVFRKYHNTGVLDSSILSRNGNDIVRQKGQGFHWPAGCLTAYRTKE